MNRSQLNTAFCRFECTVPLERDGRLCPAAAALKAREMSDPVVERREETGPDLFTNTMSTAEDIARMRDVHAANCGRLVTRNLRPDADYRLSVEEIKSELEALNDRS